MRGSEELDRRSTEISASQGQGGDFETVLEEQHKALDEFSRGLPEPWKALCTNGDDITLANPFGPVARGWKQVSEGLDYASSRFRDGTCSDIEEVARYESDDLITMLEIERWTTRLGDREKVEPFELRVTTTYRREDGTWKVVARHADPLRTFNPAGPLRTT